MPGWQYVRLSGGGRGGKRPGFFLWFVAVVVLIVALCKNGIMGPAHVATARIHQDLPRMTQCGYSAKTMFSKF